MKSLVSRRYGLSGLALGWLIFVGLLALLANWLPLPYSPDALDQQGISLPPSIQAAAGAPAAHWLGTDPFGRDVLALLVFGARTALLVSVPAAVLSTLLGVGLGGAAGFWGNKGLRFPAAWWLAAGGLLLAAFLNFSWLANAPIYYKLLIISTLYLCLYFLIQRTSLARRRWPLPIDSTLRGIMALISSIPLLVLVLALAAVQQPSPGGLLLVLVGTYWTGTARLARAEVLRVRTLPFVEAAYAAGLPAYRVLWRHALPNAWQPIRVSFPLGVASLIGLETTLSFLGIGLPPEVPSWGRTLAAARSDTAAWWLIVFPGLALVLTILALRQLSTPASTNGK